MSKKKYSILVIEHGDEFELCQCDSNPEAVVAAAKKRTKKVYKSPGETRKSTTPFYASVRYVENAP